MDIELARTFLEIASSGSFMRAADRLNVTQTAVSARVRSLESLLARSLFVRNKAGASLTPAGEEFSRFARALVQTWEQARHQVAVPAGRRAVFTLGCEATLWEPLLTDWLGAMHRGAPHLALRVEVGVPGDLLDKVADAALDLALLYAPQQRPGLKIELLIEEKLVLVTTAKRAARPTASEYVFVDWGREFTAQHDLAFPDLANAPMAVGLGPLGLAYILESGGAGYFRLSAVRPHLKSRRLRQVEGAPVFLHPAYAVYAAGADPKLIRPALAAFRKVLAAA